MEAATFERLLAWLLSNTSFSSSRHVEAAEKLMMFLWIVGHGCSNRDVVERFFQIELIGTPVNPIDSIGTSRRQ